MLLRATWTPGSRDDAKALNAGMDVAHSPGTTAVYFQLGSAWFRP